MLLFCFNSYSNASGLYKSDVEMFHEQNPTTDKDVIINNETTISTGNGGHTSLRPLGKEPDYTVHDTAVTTIQNEPEDKPFMDNKDSWSGVEYTTESQSFNNDRSGYPEQNLIEVFLIIAGIILVMIGAVFIYKLLK